ncbi:MAG: hypothetical protein ACK41V_12730 [Acidovorax sp.]|uniref:hypothetical protein n=1 Tax=Acidovorax sp. TaxID=1872122 RepID=UPI0039198647
MTTAKFSEILDGYEFCSLADLMDTQAFVSLERGTVHVVSSDLELEEELPEDIETGPYLALPGKRELDLGRELAMEFTEKILPGSVDTVRGFFHRRGAYGHFKAHLDRSGQLNAWFEFERSATEARLRQWCADHGIDLV